MADFFEEHEQRELIRFGDRAFEELLARLHRAQIGATKERKRGGALEYEDKYVTLLDQHKIFSTLEEIADLYINDAKKMVLDFSESRELAVLKRPTPAAPAEYTGLRWSLFKSPNRHLAKGQDFCYLEVMKPYFAQNGRRGWAKLSHSIESTICPDFSRSLNVNRGQLYFCGVLFQETSQPGVLNGFFYYNVDRTGIPSVLAPAIMKARGKNNAELINHYAKLSRLLAGASKEQAATLAHQLKADERCGACSNRMPKWKTKHKCHFCNAYMCKTCSKIVEKNYRVEKLGKRRRACFACADEHGVKLTRMDDEDASASSRSRNSSNASSSRDCGPPHSTGGSRLHTGGSVASSTPTAVGGLSKTGRSSSEPLYRHQQYHEMQQQQQQQRQHAELLRFRNQIDGVPQRIRVDSSAARGSPVSSHKSEPAFHRVEQPRRPSHTPQHQHERWRPQQPSQSQQQQQPTQPHSQPQNSSQRRPPSHWDPFADARPPKAVSEQGFSLHTETASGAATALTRAMWISKFVEEPPTVAALDLSYLNSYK